MKKYTDQPIQVRLHQIQENKLNEMIKNESYCMKKGIFNKSDAIRTGLNNVLKDYEYTTLGTWINSVCERGYVSPRWLIYWEIFRV